MGWKSGMSRIRLALAAVIALGSISPFPAYAAGEQSTEVISVKVPVEAPCALMPDGRVIAPSGLAIRNEDVDDEFIVDAYTQDDKGHEVDFTLDLGGKRVLTRSGGHDSADYAVLPVASDTALSLSVSKLSRQSNAALMDAAANGGTDMFQLGFKFSMRDLQGRLSVRGDEAVGSTLTAEASGMQPDGKPGYQWYRDGSVIEGAIGKTYVTTDGDAGHDITCKVIDTSGRYTGTLTSNAIRPVRPEPVAFAVYSADDGSLSFYNRSGVPSIGSRFEGKVVTDVFKGFEEEAYPYGDKVPWNKYAGSVKSVIFVDEVAPKSTACWFSNFENMTSVELRKLDTGRVSDMSEMFYGCRRLKDLDLSSFDTSSATNMEYMFAHCDAVTSLDLSRFDTSLVTDISDMFLNCDLLESADVSGFDTSRLIEMQNLFMDCPSLVSVDLSSFDTSNVTSMWMLFHGDYKLQQVTLGGRFAWKADYGPGSGMLPKPDPSHIPGADGKWYNSDGIGFTCDKIPSNVADTYTAWNPNLQGTVRVTGSVSQNALNASVSGAQSDAVLAYQWYKVKSVSDTVISESLPMMNTKTWRIRSGDNGRLSVSMMDSNYPRNGYYITVTDEDGVVIYNKGFTELESIQITLPHAGYYDVRVENSDPFSHHVYASLVYEERVPIEGATSSSYPVKQGETGTYYCIVTDSSGKYKGQLVSNDVHV